MDKLSGISRCEDLVFLRITASRDEVADFCQRWQIAELSLFGSVLRDDFNQESDIDVLISFKPGTILGLEFVSMADEMETLLGRPVDVLTRPALKRSPNFIRRKEILGSARTIYAADTDSGTLEE